MAIQVRRGLEADFDADKMVPGEWAVSTDTKYVRMCFEPGIVLRMATYESFEADVSMMQDILADCKDIQTAIKRIQTEINQQARITVEYSKSAHEYAQSAAKSAQEAKRYADNASAVTNVQIAAKTRAGIIKGGENGIAEDGTLELAKSATDRVLLNSYAANANIKKIIGKSEQDGVPTTEYIIPVKSVGDGGDLIITATGKNLVDIPNGTYEVSLYVNCNLKAGHYIYSFEEFVSSDSGPYGLLVDCGDYGMSEILFNKFVNEIEFETEFDIVGIEIFAGEISSDSIGDTFTLKNAMVRKHGTNKEYVPVQGSNSIIIPLSEPLRQYDKIVKQDGVWGILRGTQVSVFDGSIDEVWAGRDYFGQPSDSALVVYGVIGIPGVIPNDTNPSLCNMATWNLTRNILNTYQMRGSNSITFCVSAITFPTIESWKERMASNPIIVEHAIETPVFEPFDTDTQMAINSLMTYDSATYISTNSEVEPVIEFEYATSLVGKIALKAVTTANRNEILINELMTLTNSISTAMVEREE